MGRKKVKYGQRITVYLSTEALAMLAKMTLTNRSSTVENCIRTCYFHCKEEEKDMNKINSEITEVINAQTASV